MFRKLLRSQKLKYGSAALAFTAVFIALIILLNAVISALDARYGLYLDITGEERYELSDITHQMFDGSDAKIEIVFCSERDKLLENRYMSMTVTLAEKYEATFPNISVRFLNTTRDYSEARRLAGAGTETQIASTDVIIRSAETGEARIVKGNAFFTQQEGSYNGAFTGFNGERRFTESILRVMYASDDTVAFITGHGESEPAADLVNILLGAGYDENEQLKIDLTTQDIPENTRLVVINNPRRDFFGYSATGTGSIDEISKLNRYLQNYGNLLVLINNETGELPELSEFLSDWGISYISGLLVTDPDNAIDSDSRQIIARYNHTPSDEGGNAAGAAIADRTDLSTSRTIMPSTTPLVLDDSKGATAVLLSSSTARAVSGETVLATGTQALMAISSHFAYEYNDLGEQVERYAHVIVSGSTDCFQSAISESTSNADLMRSILYVAGTEGVVTGIESKPFLDTSLSTIGTATSRKMTLFLTLLPTGIVLLLGIYVFIRRKRL